MIIRTTNTYYTCNHTHTNTHTNTHAHKHTHTTHTHAHKQTTEKTLAILPTALTRRIQYIKSNTLIPTFFPLDAPETEELQTLILLENTQSTHSDSL